MKQRVEQHTNDELDRSATIGCVDLGSADTTAGLRIRELLLPLVEAAEIVPWFCKACDKLCNLARSNCVADTPVSDTAGAGAGPCEIEFVVRCGGSVPSVRDKIDDKAVEEDKVARALDIFNGAFGLDVRFGLSLVSFGAGVDGCTEKELCGVLGKPGLILWRSSWCGLTAGVDA